MALSHITYTISSFRLSKSYYLKLESLMAKFRWEQGREEIRFHWVSWHKLCQPKCLGGLEFKVLEYFNIALLVKQGWHIMHEKNSLLHSVHKARYFPHSHLFDAKLGYNKSYVWRGIWKTLPKLKRGYLWHIGSGTRVNVWADQWIPNAPMLCNVGEYVAQKLSCQSLIMCRTQDGLYCTRLYYYRSHCLGRTSTFHHISNQSLVASNLNHCL